MNDEQLYRRWQEMFSELITEIRDKFEPQLIYESSLPTFFREKIERVDGTDSIEPGLTRLEWLPDLPPGVEWPQHEGRAMDFVAQINLSDLEAGFHPLLPGSGWLYFFVGDFWDQNVIPHRVFYYDGPVTELVRTSPPPNLEPPEMMNKDFGLINFRPGFSLNPNFLDGINSWSFNHDPAKEPLRDLKFPLYGECQPEISRIGGYMYAFQGGGWDRDALLYLNGFEALIRHGYFHVSPLFRDENAKEQYYRRIYEGIVNAGDLQNFEQQAEKYGEIHDELEKHTEPIEILFGLESAMGRCWVDVGFLQFFIRQDDLANRNFERTYCDIIST